MNTCRKLSETALIAVLAALVITLAGCGSSSEEEEKGYQTIVAEYASLYLPMDEDGYIYETALDAVGAYVSGDTDSSEALTAVEDAIAELDERMDGIETYTMETEFSELLEEYDIIPEEFEAFADCRNTYLYSYILDLETLAAYLENADTDEYEYEQVVFWQAIMDAIHEAEKGYYYYGCQNYWFASWDEEQVAYLDEQVTNVLQSYITDSFYWVDDRTTAEDLASRYLDIVEEYISLIAEHAAQVTEDYAALQKELEEIQKIAEENE